MAVLQAFGILEKETPFVLYLYQNINFILFFYKFCPLRSYRILNVLVMMNLNNTLKDNILFLNGKFSADK